MECQACLCDVPVEFKDIGHNNVLCVGCHGDLNRLGYCPKYKKAPPMPNNQDAVLKPCPFCGCKELSIEKENFYYHKRVKCKECCCEHRFDRWQQRTPTPREQELDAPIDAMHEHKKVVIACFNNELEQRTASYTSKIAELEAQNKALWELVGECEKALRHLVYETTHLSPQRDDGAHDCRISALALRYGRESLVSIQKAKEGK